MKQCISRKQWQELTLGQQRKFQETLGHGGFPTIGDMIEFLDESESIVDIAKKDEVTGKWFRVCWGERLIDNYDELCDALWEAVKGVLEK